MSRQGELLPLPPMAVPRHWSRPGYIRWDRPDLYELIRRVSHAAFAVANFIEDVTRSHPDSPEFADPDMYAMRCFTGFAERTIEAAITELERKRMIEREFPDRKHHRGGMKLRYGHFGETPLPAPKPPRCQPREAKVAAPAPIAALHASAEAQPAADGLAPGDPIPAYSPDLRVSPDIRFGAQESALQAGPPPSAAPLDDATATLQDQPQPPAAPDPHPAEHAALRTDLQRIADRHRSFCGSGWRCPYLFSSKQQQPPSSSSGAVTTPGGMMMKGPEARLLEALHAEKIAAETPFAALLWKACRKRAPDITADEVIALIREKTHLAKGKHSESGFLLSAVTNACTGDGFDLWRAKRTEEATREARQRELAREARARGQDEQKREARRILDDPASSERDRELAREVLGRRE